MTATAGTAGGILGAKIKNKAVLLAIVAMGGCASMSNDPYIKDISVPRREKIESAEQRDKLSYLARFVLSADDRQQQRARIQKVHPGWTEFDTHVAVSAIASQATTANMFSRSGSNTFGNAFVALSVASMFLPDGSMDNTSGFFLPARLNGADIDKADAALTVFWQWREKQVAQAAGALQRESRCVFQCDSPAMRIYELRTAANAKPLPGYIYNPELLYVRIELFQGNMKPAAEDTLQSWALGFIP